MWFEAEDPLARFSSQHLYLVAHNSLGFQHPGGDVTPLTSVTLCAQTNIQTHTCTYRLATAMEFKRFPSFTKEFY